MTGYPQKHPISAEEYLRMGEAGVFAPEARLELIEGEIVEMAPIHPPHAGLVRRLSRLLFQQAGPRAQVSVQAPLVLSGRSVPQPDLALLKPRADDYMSGHPEPSDVLLVIEVSDTTLAFDSKVKAALYARGGIAEMWVVDVSGRAIQVYREPVESGYRVNFSAPAGKTVGCRALPGIAIDVGALFHV
jgi:Uma2 family endonuclease